MTAGRFWGDTPRHIGIGRRLGGCIVRGFNQLRRGEAVAIHGFGPYQRENGDETCLSGEFLTAVANARPRCATRQMRLR